MSGEDAAAGAALHGLADVLNYIDMTRSAIEGQGWLWGSPEVSEMLQEIRDGLTSAPEWSQVVEFNLREELRLSRVAASGWWLQARANMAALERARRVAVLLEQALALAEGQNALCTSTWMVNISSGDLRTYNGFHECALPVGHGGSHVERLHGWRWTTDNAAAVLS